jgi:hypothetical protein
VCGAVTRKPIAMVLMQKYCRICSLADATEAAPVKHTCSINHIGSSGSMDASVLVEMFHDLYDTNMCLVTTIVTDDNSKMKATLRWNNEGHKTHHGTKPCVYSTSGAKRVRANTGRLRYPIPEPTFLADPAHRKK